ncbi:RHS repeat domain-containing protein [Intrasporangium oryzae]|nr:hypothetical protein [Intrasporangium oryzae]
MSLTTVATYAYDDTGRMVTERDPRTGLGTDYTWDGASTRIASVRQNTLAATKLTYGSGRLTQVSREAPVEGQPDVTVARYVYDIATSGTGLPNLTGPTGVTAWHQAKAPVTGYAVFGQDYTGPVSGTSVDWTYADLSYVDDLGYTVNSASYGAGAWQITSTDYDTTTNNVVRQLDASATAATAKATPAMTPAQVDTLSTQTLYNNEVKDSSGTVVLPAGSRVTDTYGPARPVVLADGTVAPLRPHTHTDYDQGAPNGGINSATGQQFSLPTTIKVTAATAVGADAETISVSTNGYGKVNSTDPNEGDGWALGTATTTSTWTNTTSSSGAITATTRYDTLGRVIEKRQPLSSGADAGTTKTAYYTAAAQSAPNTDCGEHPEWAGLTCRTYPAAAPDQGPSLPDETTTYTMWLHPSTVVEASGGATRTTTTTYDAAERPVSTRLTATGLTGSTPRPGSYTKYRPNGLVDYTGALNSSGTDADTAGRTTYNYDRWARPTTVTGDAGPVTTSYNPAGKVDTVTDAKGSRSYGYDGTDAAGKLERRGLVTSLTVSRPGTGGALTYAAGYDADGQLTRQGMPGGITQVTSYDEGGEPVGLTYLGQVTPVTASTDPDTGETVYTPGTPQQDQPWMSWSTVNDITGRARLLETGTGAAFDNGTGVASIEDVAPWTADAVGQGSSYAREYRYDPAGRLTYARSAESTPTPDTASLASTCTERTYAFDANGRQPAKRSRCTQTATAPAPGPPPPRPRPDGTPPTGPPPDETAPAPTPTTCSAARPHSRPRTPPTRPRETSPSATTTTTCPAASPRATPTRRSPSTRPADGRPKPPPLAPAALPAPRRRCAATRTRATTPPGPRPRHLALRTRPSPASPHRSEATCRPRSGRTAPPACPSPTPTETPAPPSRSTRARPAAPQRCPSAGGPATTSTATPPAPPPPTRSTAHSATAGSEPNNAPPAAGLRASP